MRSPRTQQKACQPLQRVHHRVLVEGEVGEVVVEVEVPVIAEQDQEQEQASRNNILCYLCKLITRCGTCLTMCLW